MLLPCTPDTVLVEGVDARRSSSERRDEEMDPLTTRAADAGVGAVATPPATLPGRAVPPGLVAAGENTSGRGRRSVVPADVKRWNWGAFLTCVPWGVGNRVWIVLLALIPWPVPGLMAILTAVAMGLKGSELAWRSKRWAGVDHFRRVQRRWAIAGVVLNVASIALMVAWPETFLADRFS
jgi:hypothetical protein